MDSEQVIEVLEKLIGPIEPAGETHTDNVRLENLKNYIEVLDHLHTEVDRISCEYEKYHQHSIKEMQQMCSKHIKSMGIKNCDCPSG